jgi:hypothetical protein
MKFTVNQITTVLVGVVLWSSCNHIDDDRKLVISSVRKAAKLATTEYVVSKAIIAENNGFLADAHLLIHTEATLKIGIDLMEIKDGDISVKHDSVFIALPEPKILHFSYPPERFELDTIYSENSILKRFKVKDYDKLLRANERQIREDFEQTQYKVRSTRSTEDFLRKFLFKAGFKYVKFQSALDTNTDVSITQNEPS